MKPTGPETKAMPMIAGHVITSSSASPRRGPNLSQIVPIMKRKTMVPATDAMLASAQFAFVMPFGMFGLTRRM